MRMKCLSTMMVFQMTTMTIITLGHGGICFYITRGFDYTLETRSVAYLLKRVENTKTDIKIMYKTVRLLIYSAAIISK